MKSNTIVINGYTFEVLRAKNMDGGAKVHEYRAAYKDSLHDCYKKCSDEKWDAYFRCKEVYEAVGGRRYRIPSSNGWTFTFAFELPNGAVIYITKDHDYIIL